MRGGDEKRGQKGRGVEIEKVYWYVEMHQPDEYSSE